MKFKIIYKILTGALIMCTLTIGLLTPLIYLYSNEYSNITLKAHNEISKIILDEVSISYIAIAKEGMREVSEDIAKSLGEYVTNNPKNLKEYTNDKAFRDLALRRIFGRGYTVITEPETYFDVAIHVPEFNGEYIYNFPGYTPEIYKELLHLIDKSVTTDGVSGEYSFYEPNGVFEDKLVYISRVPAKTKDQKNMVVLSIAYKDDFLKKAHELNTLVHDNFMKSTAEVEAKGHWFIFATIITVLFIFLLSILLSLFYFRKLIK